MLKPKSQKNVHAPASNNIVTFCLGTEVLRHSAGSVGPYGGTYVCRTLIVFITNNTALCMLGHIGHVLYSIANREFPVSIQVQGCG